MLGLSCEPLGPAVLSRSTSTPSLRRGSTSTGSLAAQRIPPGARFWGAGGRCASAAASKEGLTRGIGRQFSAQAHSSSSLKGAGALAISGYGLGGSPAASHRVSSMSALPLVVPAAAEPQPVPTEGMRQVASSRDSSKLVGAWRYSRRSGSGSTEEAFETLLVRADGRGQWEKCYQAREDEQHEFFERNAILGTLAEGMPSETIAADFLIRSGNEEGAPWVLEPGEVPRIVIRGSGWHLRRETNGENKHVRSSGFEEKTIVLTVEELQRRFEHNPS